ncbi:MAG: tRNA pseudouridine(55) synthase TruB [Candidatus Omnitrophota bacterium]
MMEGIIVVDKPSGMTSHDVVARVRRRLNMKRIGHAGTLDPLATGVLIILVGPSTRLFDRFVGFDKAYLATMQLGLKTRSADIQGETLEEKPFAGISRQDIEQVFTRFTGNIEQLPPMVSAVKYKGERLYKIARTGVTVEREPRKIRIDVLKVLDFSAPFVKFCLDCSKGTYVRQVAEDVGDVLGCGACITEIRRTKVGPFGIETAVTLEDLNETHLKRWPAA